MLVDTDDIALIELLQSKPTKNQAFTQLLKKYQETIYYFLRRTGLEHETADDLIQEVFLNFWELPNADLKNENLIIILYRLSVASLNKNAPTDFGGLTFQEQAVMVLKTHEDLDFQEIAQIITIPVNDIRQIFKSAINKISNPF